VLQNMGVLLLVTVLAWYKILAASKLAFLPATTLLFVSMISEK
jgi:hypothetical protein